MNRRTFGSTLGSALVWPVLARARKRTRTTPLYSVVGENLSVYDLDVEAANLTLRKTIQLPASLQYAWPSPDRRFFYAVADRGGMAPATLDLNQSGGHYGFAFRVDPVTGELTPHGPQVPLPSRPIYMSLDHSGRFMLTCYPEPANITVHHIDEDGALGDQVEQPSNLDYGNYPHCIRTSPSNKTLVMVTRGNNPTENRPENPGAIKVFGFNEGRLSNIASLVNGPGFGPRHMDFDPKRRFAYFSLERNNRMDVYGVKPDSTLTTEALFKCSTLRDPNDTHISGQGPGAIHVHSNGHIVYVSNRSELATERNGKKVWAGGENNIAVFSIDQKSGEPTLIQTVDTNGIEPRTFTMDSSMRILVAASQEAMPILNQEEEGATISMLSAGLSIFRIGWDGQLTFVRKVDVDTPCCREGQGPQTRGIQFWCGTLAVA